MDCVTAGGSISLQSQMRLAQGWTTSRTLLVNLALPKGALIRRLLPLLDTHKRRRFAQLFLAQFILLDFFIQVVQNAEG